MDDINIIEKVLKEVKRACAKFPEWPDDPIHALAIVQEEVGELQKEVLQCCYEPDKSSSESVRREAYQAAAMMLRFLRSFEAGDYMFSDAPTHPQAMREL